jgi:phage recombination protein Bet
MSTSLAVFEDPKQVALIRRTVAKDATSAEFDQFIHICKAVRLDPIRRQIYCFIMGKNDPKKRQMTIVTSIGGYRAIAERTGNYRPGKTQTFLGEEKDSACNPLGISHAEATVYKYVHGEWHEITESAYWSEFAPLKEIWAPDETGENRPSGKFQLDPKKDNWRRMPRVMIEKCAEAKALRRAWPDDFDGLMAEDEMDRAHTLDLTATELAEAGEQTQRLEQIGGGSKILMDWMDGEPLSPVPVGQLGDQAIAFIRKNKEEPSSIISWQERNRHGLQQFWAMDKDAALAVKQEIEKATAA